MKIMEATERLLNRLIEFLAILSGFILLLLVFINTFAVCKRYLFNDPIEWSLSVSCMLMVACVFLCGAYTLKVDSHVSINIIVNRLSDRSKNYLALFKYILILIFMGLLAWQGSILAWENVHSVTESIDRLPLFPSYLMVPIGSVLLCLHAFFQICKTVKEIIK